GNSSDDENDFDNIGAEDSNDKDHDTKDKNKSKSSKIEQSKRNKDKATKKKKKKKSSSKESNNTPSIIQELAKSKLESRQADEELARRNRIDAIWAEMNTPTKRLPNRNR